MMWDISAAHTARNYYALFINIITLLSGSEKKKLEQKRNGHNSTCIDARDVL